MKHSAGVSLGVLAAFLSFGSPAARASTLGTGTDYAVIDLGSGTTFGWNTPVTGNVIVGNGVTANFAGGASATGTLFYDSSTLGQSTFTQVSPLGGGPTLVTGPTPSSTVTGTLLANANALATSAAGLTAPLSNTFTGTVTTATTLTGVAGQNVFSFDNIHNAALTISGPSTATFVINVSGEYQTNVSMILTGGVIAADILFNFTGTSGQVLNTSGGDCSGKTCLFGTFLATDGGAFQFSNLNLFGELINTKGNIQLVSGSEVTAPPVATPLPAALPLFATALGGLGLVGWRRKRKAQAVA